MIRWLPLWLLPQIVAAASFGLAWDFDRSYAPPPQSFLITYTDADGQLQQMQTPPSPRGACATAVAATDNTFCTMWPTCPSVGVMTFWVQAYWSETLVSDKGTPLLMCLFTTSQPCICQDPLTTPPPPVERPIPPQPPTLPVFEPKFPPAPA
jgi:hypothetical protein